MSKHSYRVNGKFAKKPQSCTPIVDDVYTKIPENHFCLVVDRSGSMDGLENQVIKFVNRWLNDIRDMSNKFGQTSYVSLIIYDNIIDVIFSHIEVNQAPSFSEYRPRNSTALFEAEERAIELLISTTRGNTGNIAYIVNHITDGFENASWGGYQNGKINGLTRRMLQLQNQGNWTFTFLLPPGNKSQFVNSYKLESGNITEWETTEKGIFEAEEKTSGGIFSYGAARSAGASFIKNFYDVKVDLSNVKNLSQVARQNNLKDYSKDFYKRDVPRECSTKELVEDIYMIRGGYYAGRVFYELTKPEKVQPNKDILVMEKGKTAIYGGSEARHLIGLPDGQYAKVDPYNLSKFKVFIRSNTSSGNRELVRGTEVLIEK